MMQLISKILGRDNPRDSYKLLLKSLKSKGYIKGYRQMGFELLIYYTAPWLNDEKFMQYCSVNIEDKSQAEICEDIKEELYYVYDRLAEIAMFASREESGVDWDKHSKFIETFFVEY